ncbi:pilus assembly protein [Pseudoduganella sp. GCM10020061]|uniref:pilus assembly protein n=1 Tax=Pseudoduganella sp. GCM10020061 TaxID=3317345 RepID=UPI00362F598B
MHTIFPRAFAAALAAGIALAPAISRADDIDIFTGASAGAAVNPRILIVLDNTSNWSRQSQQWPGGITQGQAEVSAIKKAITKLNANVNVGIMEFVPGNVEGGYVRHAVSPMNDVNKTALKAKLDTIYANINSPTEKRNSSAPYGTLMRDVYNYFAGANSTAGSNTPSGTADANGYTTLYSKFKAPLTNEATCGRSFIIFIGNPNSSGPDSDPSSNTQALAGLGGITAQLGLPAFTSSKILVPASVGTTTACYANQQAAEAELPAFATKCAAYSEGCSIGAPVQPAPLTCAPNTSTYHVIGTNEEITNVATGGSSTDTRPMNADEWARFMHDKGVPVAGSDVRPYVTTYTIDVYNKQPNAVHTSLLLSMAKVGGGKYFAAQSEQAIMNAMEEILGEVLSVNNSFASTSLPVNATNRSQNENQVFIGMFRPDPDASPRWFGNLKRYQLISRGDTIELGDVTGKLAVNTLTGFVTPCAISYWTSGSGNYWAGLGINPDPAGSCTVADAYSDSPDGPLVEKGAVAQVLRNGNNPPTTTASPTYAVNRTIYTQGTSGLTAFNTTSSRLSDSVVRFIRGEDVNNEKGTNSLTTTRPSIHGDVIHSRPLPINYGGTTGVVVYYGANDGTFRSVHAATGKENWAFIAPEFFPRLERLKTETPQLNYPTASGPSTSATAMPKDYFFDGSTGVYQNADSSAVWVFPTMRRGGRMIYALDVSTPTAPVFKWKAGCPNLTNDLNCTDGMEGIGQTWSTPAVAFIKGFSTETPVIVVGGGYDSCEDANLKLPACSSTKGGFVYVLNADTGALLASFPTARGVAADISLVDIDNDAMPDYAYAADIGGNIYRINFIDGPETREALAREDWAAYKVAFTSGDGRKFLFGPALFAARNKVYIAIGSGDREHPLAWQYPYNEVRNRFYVRLDDLTVSNSELAYDLDEMSDYSANTTCSSPGVLPTGNLAGWYMDLAQGEQVVTSALIASGMVTFSTNRPMSGSSTSCSAALGEAKGYWVNLFNASGGIGVDGTCGGQRSSIFIGGGLPPSPVMASGVPVAGRAVSVVIGAVQKSGGASVAISPQKIRPAINSKRKRSYTYTK